MGWIQEVVLENYIDSKTAPSNMKGGAVSGGGWVEYEGKGFFLFYGDYSGAVIDDEISIAGNTSGRGGPYYFSSKVRFTSAKLSSSSCQYIVYFV